MKKSLLLAALIAFLPFGCKTHKAIQISKNEDQTASLDSSWLKRDTLNKNKDSSSSRVKTEDRTVEEYSETNIVIHAPDAQNFDVPGNLHLDSTSSLDTLKFSNDKQPKTGLNIYKGQKGTAVAELQTGTGKQVFKNFSSIEINSKKWKKTTTGKKDSSGASLVTKILKNSIDSGAKHADSAKTVQMSKTVEKDSKASAWSLFAGFWWIPITGLVLLLLLWKGGAIINWIKSKI